MYCVNFCIECACTSPELPCYSCKGGASLCRTIAKENFLMKETSRGKPQLNKIKVINKIQKNWREYEHQRKKNKDILEQFSPAEEQHQVKHKETEVVKTKKKHEIDYKSLCWNCSITNTKLYKCGGCYKARYCNRKCIEEDWEVHGPYCTKKQEKRKKEKAWKGKEDSSGCSL